MVQMLTQTLQDPVVVANGRGFILTSSKVTLQLSTKCYKVENFQMSNKRPLSVFVRHLSFPLSQVTAILKTFVQRHEISSAFLAVQQ